TPTHIAHLGCDVDSRLYGVSMKVGIAVFPGHPRQLAYRFDRANLVVRMHDADQDGVRSQRLPKRIWIHQPEAIDAQAGDLEAVSFQRLCGAQHRIVLDRRGDDVPSPVAVPAGDSLEG